MTMMCRPRRQLRSPAVAAAVVAAVPRWLQWQDVLRPLPLLLSLLLLLLLWQQRRRQAVLLHQGRQVTDSPQHLQSPLRLSRVLHPAAA